jgi:hypothetical protein
MKKYSIWKGQKKTTRVDLGKRPNSRLELWKWDSSIEKK